MGSVLAVEVDGIWWTRRDAGGRSGWGVVRVQLAVTEEASLRATWDQVSRRWSGGFLGKGTLAKEAAGVSCVQGRRGKKPVWPERRPRRAGAFPG